jgi:hypothetical protein
MGSWQPFFFDDTQLIPLAERHAREYQTATPFPHVVLDDFLPVDVTLACADEFPGPSEVPWDLYTDEGKTRKLATEKEEAMPPLIRQVVQQFNSGPMVRFLETLTGITGLVADPHLVGGGMHRIEPGGFLDIHADFNRHTHLELDRRINVLFYLNPDWNEAWGGHLELWNRTMTGCERRIAPLLNRCVIFNTTDFSFHGHPDRLACPPGIARKSLAFYYYSSGRPAGEQSVSHSTIFQTPGQVLSPVTTPAPPVVRLRHALGRRVPPRVKTALRQAVGQLGGPAAGRSSPSSTEARAVPENHWTRTNRLFGELAEAGPVPRPNYTWSLLHVGGIARTLGLKRITAIEFGVAGGNGLVALEDAAEAVRQRLGVHVDVVGFDHGIGLPAPTDYRDAPYLMEAGQFAMDEPKLRARLRNASLRLGLVRDTLPDFIASGPAPIGFVSCDLDFYSSTMDSFQLFDASPEHFLPRVLCYFDDVLGYPWGDSNGERRAIIDFNREHEGRVIDHLPGLRFMTPPSQFNTRWVEAMYLVHILDHPRYAEDEGVAIATSLDLT